MSTIQNKKENEIDLTKKEGELNAGGDNRMVYFNPKLALQPTGFNNIGAICWFNSLLQCLMSCTALTQLFQNPAIQNKNALCRAYYNLLQNPSPEKSLLVLQQLVLKLRNKVFGMGQEDVNEGFVKLIDAFASSDIEYIMEHRFVITIKCPNCYESWKSKNDTSIFLEYYPSGGEVLELNSDRILNFNETVNGVICPTCKFKGDGFTRITRLTATPEILVLLFKNKYTGKVQINCPPTFNIPSLDPNKPFTYKMVATAEHFGNMGGGHYYAHALRSDDKCYRLNDNGVTEIPKLEASPSTYMVIYHVL